MMIQKQSAASRAFKPSAFATPARKVACKASNEEPAAGRRELLASILLGAALFKAPEAKAEAFLVSTGAKGPLAEEEALLYKMRQEREGEARRELLEVKEQLEMEGKASQNGKLCATPFGVDIVGITEFVLFIGALVGGTLARQRKQEVERLNESLRKINLQLRQQARAGQLYAPGLSYAPPASGTPAPTPTPTRPSTPEASTLSAAVAVAVPTTTYITSMDEDMSPDQLQCRQALKEGKRLLKESNGAASLVRFEKALMLSKAIGDKVQERRAVRGLAAASRLTGQYRAAIKHLERVLEISKEMNEFTGDADAYGVIADCYTDLDEFEKAAMYYDKYIDAMNKA